LNSDRTYLSPFEGQSSYYGIGAVLYIGGAMVYVYRAPERLWPKRFDIVGASHQIFHVAVVIAAALHFNASMNIFLDRHNKVCPLNLPEI